MTTVSEEVSKAVDTVVETEEQSHRRFERFYNKNERAYRGVLEPV